jgi:protein disulfide-isomerase-like protein
MRSIFKTVAVLLSLSMTIAHGADEGHEKTTENLIDLDQDSFDRLVVDPQTNKLVGAPWMIMFYAPWCGHCKRLMPIFDEFAKNYADGTKLNVGRVNCDEGNNSNLCTSYDVGGFPTVLFLNQNQFYEFRSERTIEGLQKFVFEEGFKDAESDAIPQKLQGIALYQKQFLKFLGQLGRSVEILFHRIGFGTLPRPVMYGIAGSIFALPVVLMCYVICCMKDEVIEIPIKKKDSVAQQPGSQKPASKTQREKLE